MKHDAIVPERDLTDWNIHNSKQASNMRVCEMLENMSDEKAVLLAETICAHKLAGLETHSIEERLKRETHRMMIATKVFFGKTPIEVKYKMGTNPE